MDPQDRGLVSFGYAKTSFEIACKGENISVINDIDTFLSPLDSELLDMSRDALEKFILEVLIPFIAKNTDTIFKDQEDKQDIKEDIRQIALDNLDSSAIKVILPKLDIL